MTSINSLNNLNQNHENNQLNNLISNPETLINNFNDNKNESIQDLNIKSTYQLGLVNNQNFPNNNDNNLTISDKAYTIKYTPVNTLADSSKYIYVNDPINVIENCNNAIVKQPTTYLQIASGCITENEYDVVLDSPQGLVYAFYFKEKSSCCNRNCCNPATRHFDMYANYVPSAKEIEHKVERRYFFIERLCGCNSFCCCCNCIRPKMKITYAKTGQYLGLIVDSWDCCNHKLEIYDNTDQLIYEIKTSCCQIGLCCGRNAETVAKIDFKTYNLDTIVGHLIKIPSTKDKTAQSEVDAHIGFHDASNSFIVNFPENATPDHKFLLIIAAIKLGYQFFTHNKSEYEYDCCQSCGNLCNYCCFPFRICNKLFCPLCCLLC